MFISDIGLYFSFFVTSFSGFGIRVVVASYNEFGKWWGEEDEGRKGQIEDEKIKKQEGRGNY